MGTEHEEHSFLMIKDKNLSQIKADLIHAFLCVCHTISSHLLFFKIVNNALVAHTVIAGRGLWDAFSYSVAHCGVM